MSTVHLTCPSCGDSEYYDFCEKNEQEESYELQCSKCEEYFTAFNEWERVVTVVDDPENGKICSWCNLYESKCNCED